MKKIYLTILCLLGTFYSFGQEWNFSSTDFTTALSSEFTESVTVSDFTVYASSTGAVKYDENSKSIDDYEFTNRLKLSGSGKFNEDGTPDTRVVGFPVSGDCTITAYGMSSSDGSTRYLLFANGAKISDFDKDNPTAATDPNLLGYLENDGSAIGKYSVSYTGDATTIYLYSASSGFNLYMVKVESTATAIDNPEISKTVVKTQYYGLNGVLVATSFEALPKGIYVKQEVYDDGTSKSSKISKTTAW